MNIFQQSIGNTRKKMMEANRLAVVMLQRIKADREHASTNLELLLDSIVAETGLELKPDNMPTIMAYVKQFIEDQHRRKEGLSEVGDDGMQDFPL
jgi:hypothetical protein